MSNISRAAAVAAELRALTNAALVESLVAVGLQMGPRVPVDTRQGVDSFDAGANTLPSAPIGKAGGRFMTEGEMRAKVRNAQTAAYLRSKVVQNYINEGGRRMVGGIMRGSLQAPNGYVLQSIEAAKRDLANLRLKPRRTS